MILFCCLSKFVIQISESYELSPRVIQGSRIINEEGIVMAFCGAEYSMMLPSLSLNSVYR